MGVRSRFGHGYNGGIYYGIGQAYMYPYTFMYVCIYTHTKLWFILQLLRVGA